MVPPEAESVKEYETVAVPEGKGLGVVMLICAITSGARNNPRSKNFFIAGGMYCS